MDKIVQRGLPGVFDYLEHTADLYIVAYGENILELFRNAGIALFESMTDTGKLGRVYEKRVVAEGVDLENLLYRWLEELLIIYYSENIMCGDILVDKLVVSRGGEDVEYRLEGLCRGEEFNPEKHESRVEIKAVTYHLMNVVRENGKWRAYFVLDI